jgi:DNA invertase Pin-like site-specific DNA recombinase
MAAQRGYEIVREYTDRISGAKARRPGLDELMADHRRGKFDVVLVWASGRIARSTRISWRPGRAEPAGGEVRQLS